MILHRHTCFKHFVNGPSCRCEDPKEPFICKFCPQDAQPMILKEELSMAAGTLMDMYRFWGEPGSGQKGGIEIRLSSGAVEDWMKQTSKPRAREIASEKCKAYLTAPELYVPLEHGIYTKGWGDGNGISHGGKFFHPQFDVSEELVSIEGYVNMSFLRAVDLTKGSVFRLEGVYMKDDTVTYAQVLTKMMDRFYTQALKSFSVQIRIQPGRNDALAPA